ncbi:hypothetical protein BGX38DRAFT_62522 [Terfezia claveryi]|nr:hypothetical protein BGX38DRAFT_62522 [Terfezia claveryi]
MTVKLSLTTPAKPFSDWNLSQVMRLYGINSENPSLNGFPHYECSRISINNNGLLTALVETLVGFLETTSLDDSGETAKSFYVHSFLNAALRDFMPSKSMFSIGPECKIEGYYGRGPVDYTIEMKGTGGVVGVKGLRKTTSKRGWHRTRFRLSLFYEVGSGKLTRSVGKLE